MSLYLNKLLKHEFVHCTDHRETLPWDNHGSVYVSKSNMPKYRFAAKDVHQFINGIKVSNTSTENPPTSATALSTYEIGCEVAT